LLAALDYLRRFAGLRGVMGESVSVTDDARFPVYTEMWRGLPTADGTRSAAHLNYPIEEYPIQAGDLLQVHVNGSGLLTVSIRLRSIVMLPTWPISAAVTVAL